MQMSDNLRLGLIGCGGLGRRQAEISLQLAGTDLVGLADVNIESAQSLAEEHNIGFATDDYRELLMADLDAVLVVTPTYTHKEIVLTAAEAGVHIFCEKPMATSVADCEEMMAAADAADVQLMTGYVLRFYPAYQEIQKMTEDGRLGDVRLAWAARMGGRPPAGIGEWRREKDKVGGLYSAACHQMDLLLWMAGPATQVTGHVNWGTFDDTDTEDSIIISWWAENGAVCSLHSSQLYPVGGSEFGLGGTNGSVKLIDTTKILYSDHDGNSETIEFEPVDGLMAELSHFFDCCKSGLPNRIPGKAGRDSLEIFEAAYTSAERKEPVGLPVTDA
jgi:predicted dehydrogenase